MKNFKKSNQQGSIFIEVMFALVLLTIFGTSLFMVQSLIFSKTSQTHNKVMSLQEINKARIDFELKVFQHKQTKKPMQDLSEDKDIKSIAASLNIAFKSIPESSPLHKKFADNVKILQESTTFDDNKKEAFISFEFIPPIPKEERK